MAGSGSSRNKPYASLTELGGNEMVRNVTLATMLLLFATQSAPAQEWAKKMFKVTNHDFGTVARGAKAEYAFELTNLYEEDVHIAGVKSSCGCSTPSIAKQTLKTFEKGAIVATYNSSSFLGKKSATITVTIDKPYFAEVQLSIVGNIRGDVVFNPGIVDFGILDQGNGSQQRVNISHVGRTDWRIADVRSANENFQVELTETERSGSRVGYEMVVYLKKSAPAGYLNDRLTIVTNDGQSKTFPLAVKGRVVSALTVSPASLFMGVLKPNQKVTKTLIIRSKSPFKVLAVRSDNDGFKFTPSVGSKVLHVIPVTFSAGNQPGKIVQTIEISTDLGSGTAASCTATATIKN